MSKLAAREDSGKTSRMPNGYWTFERCLETAKLHTVKNEWMAAHPGACDAARRKGWFKACTDHMKHGLAAPKKWTLNRCKASAAQYETRTKWFRGDPGAYGAATKRGWLDLCCTHMVELRKPNGHWTIERCSAVAREYHSRVAWRSACTVSYDVADRNGWLDECCQHMSRLHLPNGHWTFERCLESALKFEDRTGWERGDSVASQTARRNGWFDICVEHMVRPKVSRFEQNIRDLLTENDVEFETNVRVNNREFDIVVDSHNLLIECNGLYWHSDNPQLGTSAKTPTYHRNKTRLASDLGYRCIHVWEHEQGAPAMRSLILAACGRTRTIHARKTRVVEVSPAGAKSFLTLNHVQGYGRPLKSRLDLGLMHGCDLVAVMSFTPAEFRHGDGKADWTLARYATAAGCRVVGGASKLFRRRPTGSIISYSDSRLFTGKMYERLGFERDGESAPDYFYTRQGRVIAKRAAQRKFLPRLLGDAFDPNLSERDNMRKSDFHKVHDCGKVRWIVR